MSRIDEIQSRVTEQSRSVLGYAADLVEWSLNNNLKLAQQAADFAVAQFRVPVEAKDLSSYRADLTEVYGDFGQALRGYAEACVSRIQELPSEFTEIFQAKASAAAPSKAGKTAKSA